MTPEEQDLVRKRQKSRAIVMGLLLAGFVVLIYAITIAKLAGS
jgi:accessory gene regulator protein AgrB